MTNIFVNAEIDKKPIGKAEFSPTTKRLTFYFDMTYDPRDIESIMPLISPDNSTLMGWSVNTHGFFKTNKKQFK